MDQKLTVQKVLNIRNKALDAAGNGILITDARLPDHPIVYCNGEFCGMTGYSKMEILGKNCRFLQNGDRDQEEIEIMRSAIQKGEPCQVTLRNYRKDGTRFWNELTITPVLDEHEELTHFIGVQKDVTLPKKEELLKDQIRKILELIIEHVPLPRIGHEITKTISGQVEGYVASILLLDREAQTLHALAAAGLPQGFIEGIEGLRSGPKAGSCGTAAFTKKEVVNEDIANDPLWEDYRELALRHGIRSSSSFPILSSDRTVLGTCAIYSGHRRRPLDRDRAIMADMVQLAGVAIEQYQTDLLLHKNRAQLEEHARQLEQKVEDRTKEVNATVLKLGETNLNLEDQVRSTKAAEKKAQASQTLFVAIAHNFPNGAIIVYNADHEVVVLEGEELRRFKLKKNDYLGVNVDALSVYSEKRKKILKEQIRKTLGGESLSFETEFRKNIYSVHTSPLYADENVAWALFVYSNVSIHRKAEKKVLKTLEKEKRLNELKSRFVAMASHEFRTPLSVILSSATLIGKQNGPGKAEKREKYVDRIKINVRSLAVILEDFLSLDRLEGGKVVPASEHFDLVQFSRSLIDEIGDSKKEGQKIVLEPDYPKMPIFLDSKMLHYILINLLSNAIKYSGEHQIIQVGISRKGKMLAIQVKDQGIGIPLEEQKPLFDLFFRAKNALNIQGTGLGLPIVKQYVSIMGGTISFESELGKGSTFFVELPLNKESVFPLKSGLPNFGLQK